MATEYKTGPQFTKTVDDRTVIGVFAVHGNIDDGQDRSHPGSLADVAIKGRDRVRHLWNHGGGWLDRGQSPPIAVVKAIRELTVDELPDAVKAYAPDATGGAEVEREYLDTPRGNEVLVGIKAGAIDEMSYAYDIVEWKNTKTDDGDYVREIYKMRLFDTSDVNWGMNPATLGKKTSVLAALPFVDHSEAVRAAVAEYVERAADINQLREKDGRHLSTAHIDRLKALYAGLDETRTAIQVLITPLEAAPPPAINRNETQRLKAEAVTRRLRLLELGAAL